MNKELLRYEAPEFEVVVFEAEDIITTSGTDPQSDEPLYPEN